MKKIGIYGGSFDPVHVDHVNICKAFYSALGLDEVCVVPARLSPFKQKNGAPAEDRYNMLRIAFSDCPFVTVSRFEIDSESVNYSYLTVKHFAKETNSKLYFLIGADSLNTFATWKNPDIIASLSTVCVVARDKENTDPATVAFYKKYGYKPVIVPFTGHCSSTVAREYLALGLSTADMLLPCVGEYIEKNDLYLPDKYHEFLRANSKPSRLVHTVGVEITAKRYAEKTGADVQKAMFAALLHDNAKYLKKEDYPDFECGADVPEPIVHQFLGAYVAEKVLGVNDEEVLNAIKWHTTGRPDMGLLEKIIYTADLLEPGRNFPGVDVLRKAVDDDFESGFRLCVRELLKFLQAGGEAVYYMSVLTDEYYNGGKN